jgi:hypothetical protein
VVRWRRSPRCGETGVIVGAVIGAVIGAVFFREP